MVFKTFGQSARGFAQGRIEARKIRRSAALESRHMEATRHFYNELERLSKLYESGANGNAVSRQVGKVFALAVSRSASIAARDEELVRQRSRYHADLKIFLEGVAANPPDTVQGMRDFVRKVRQKSTVILLSEPKFAPALKELFPWFAPSNWKTGEGRKYVGWRTLTFATAWGDFTNFLPVSEVVGGVAMAGLLAKSARDRKKAERIASTDPDKAEQLVKNSGFWREKIFDFRTLLTLNPVPGLQADYWLLFSPLFAAAGIEHGQMIRLNRALLRSINSINERQISLRSGQGKPPTKTQLLVRKFFAKSKSGVQ